MRLAGAGVDGPKLTSSSLLSPGQSPPLRDQWQSLTSPSSSSSHSRLFLDMLHGRALTPAYNVCGAAVHAVALSFLGGRREGPHAEGLGRDTDRQGSCGPLTPPGEALETRSGTETEGSRR